MGTFDVPSLSRGIPLPLAEPDAGPAAVLGDKDHAIHLERAPHIDERAVVGRPGAALEIREGLLSHFGLLGELRLRPAEQGACRARLARQKDRSRNSTFLY
jgi:hypothetical protein